MNTIDLNGNIVKWVPSGQSAVAAKSEPHLKARTLLRTIFFSAQILEEVAFNPKPKQVLYLDFYLPSLKIAVEVQGSQHDNYTPFFHKNIINYGNSKIRDSDKKKWCELNNIRLIELPESEDENEWRERIS
jgi:hypothetical protein